MVAHSPSRSKGALGGFYRRMSGKYDAATITATAHKLACIIYAVLKNQTEYCDHGEGHVGLSMLVRRSGS